MACVVFWARVAKVSARHAFRGTRASRSPRIRSVESVGLDRVAMPIPVVRDHAGFRIIVIASLLPGVNHFASDSKGSNLGEQRLTDIRQATR